MAVLAQSAAPWLRRFRRVYALAPRALNRRLERGAALEQLSINVDR